uniref:Ppx/GppA family phosphatase n=1 Tax=Eiseniibacteriota bacterium TaxID=2212470 RepID=A0A832MLE9_UNCEI
MRIAALDIGTNSVHMVVASASGATGFTVLDREREVVQVGRGSFAGGRLRADAMQRTVDAVARQVRIARRHQVDHILCTATAAVREAKNGGDFLRAVRDAAGVLPRVIPSEEEGRLIYLAVKSALELPEAPCLVVDIGGGSVQLVVGDRERHRSVVGLPLGALRLTELMLASDPPSRRELQRLRRHVRRTARAALERIAAQAPQGVYGSSGSIHALAAAAHELDTGRPLEHLNGHVASTASLVRLTRRLQRMTRAERERLPGVDASRAEIIVPGAIVLTHILESLGAEGITISDYGVREGLVTDYLQSHPREVVTLERGEGLRHRSVLQLLARFQLNERHAQHVARLALALFDGLRAAHGLGEDTRELLRYAALLHDVGAVLGYDGHGAHSYYIIRHANLRGLSAAEVELVALAARYHGKERPRKKDPLVRALPRAERSRLRWLAAILRVAEGLDRSHYQLVRGLRVARRKGRVSILIAARRDAQLEVWAARRRTALLERLLGVSVRVAADRTSGAARDAGRRARAEGSPAPPAVVLPLRAGRGARS